MTKPIRPPRRNNSRARALRPQPHGNASGEGATAVGGEGHTPDISHLLLGAAQLPPALHIPQPHDIVPAAREDAAAVGGEGHAPDPIRLPGPPKRRIWPSASGAVADAGAGVERVVPPRAARAEGRCRTGPIDGAGESPSPHGPIQTSGYGAAAVGARPRCRPRPGAPRSGGAPSRSSTSHSRTVVSSLPERARRPSGNRPRCGPGPSAPRSGAAPARSPRPTAAQSCRRSQRGRGGRRREGHAIDITRVTLKRRSSPPARHIPQTAA